MSELVRLVHANDYAALDQARGLAEYRDPDGCTLLHNAMIRFDDAGTSARMIDYLVARGVPVDVASRSEQWTALHFAARDCGADIVTALLRGGAAVDPVDRHGNTPLWVAASDGKHELAVIEVLIAHGADPRRKNGAGISPMDIGERMARAGNPATLAALTGARAAVPAAKPYSARARFAVGDRVEHPTFGVGVVVATPSPDKIQVEFYEGTKLLVHAKAPPAAPPRRG